MSDTAAPCLILDDDDLQKQSKQIQWRKDDARDINGLFNSTKTVSKFPGAFQTYKKDSGQVPTTKFPFMKGQKKSMPVQKVMDASGIVFTPEFIAEHGVPLLRLPELVVAAVQEDDDPPYAACTPPGSP